MNFSTYLPAVNAPKSTIGAVYGAGVPLVIGYALYESGMPEDVSEWAVAIVLALVAVGFLMNLIQVQIAAAPAA
jgi:hypothetical protein